MLIITLVKVCTMGKMTGKFTLGGFLNSDRTRINLGIVHDCISIDLAQVDFWNEKTDPH